ncbi:MATE family efflux transporter [Halalkalibacter nanhaiisediminis]|uniref:Probable multidrug resistance protein NorM n=1 Tax=Halalkalibacter nanhaiisediminis TaxID=688079 RepID=A0A562QBH0_9BACI|nr:MATE family efflux transporter [Halalkalibacter nanhaiisediminis]TWI54101.1 MATE family multidrug resistance protein [Halalkalibacter nanhaiisediminis]
MKQATSSLEKKSSSALSHREYLVMAIPLIIAGISTPLLGAVDTAVVGRMPDPSAIGGVAIGALIFNTMYWLLGFLRVSTTGFTSQAQGSKDEKETILSFVRPIIIAIFFGLCFIILQQPILHLAFYLIGASEAVTELAETYFSIRIWGAPFTLVSYVMIGWLIGMGKVRLALATQLLMNILNIILDMIFVFGLGFGVAGVAYATLISEVSAVLFGAWIIYRTRKVAILNLKMDMLLETAPFMKMVKVNRDLFLRTVCLLAMTGIFTAKGASMGEVTLAANAVLLQIHYMMAYLFGGFANASSILVGRAIGAGDQSLYKRAFLLSAQWGFISAIVLACGIVLFGETIVSLFTSIMAVKETAFDLLVWMIIFPFVGFWGLQLEGIFSGATEAGFIRDSIVLSLIVFLLAIWLFVPSFHNQGVWLSFVLFSLSRSLFLWLFVPKLTRVKFS